MPRMTFIAALRFWYKLTEKRRDTWKAGYKIDVHFRDKEVKHPFVQIDGIESAECPKSVMLRNPEAVTLIETFNQSRNIKGALGSPERWPAALYDAMCILTTQEKIDKAARESAVHSA